MPASGSSFRSARGGDILYFNPTLSAGMKENPFKSLKREYPVEMPYARDEVYVLNMEVPRGYKINELPKSVKIVLNGDAGFFEYGIAVNDNTIQLRSRILLKKAIFEPEDYTAIREFFGNMVKKQNEFIVFKKDGFLPSKHRSLQHRIIPVTNDK